MSTDHPKHIDITKPATEIEIAELLEVLLATNSQKFAMTVRRMAFELDALRLKVAMTQAVVQGWTFLQDMTELRARIEELLARPPLHTAAMCDLERWCGDAETVFRDLLK